MVPLCSKEMEDFFKKNGIVHICTAPFHPSSNSAAENLVRILRILLKNPVAIPRQLILIFKGSCYHITVPLIVQQKRALQSYIL